MTSERRFYLATQIVMGPNVVEKIPQEISALGCDRVLVVTDAGVVKAGIVDRILGVMKASSIHAVVFDQTEPDPCLATAEKCAEMMRAEKVSLIVAVNKMDVKGANLDQVKAQMQQRADALIAVIGKPPVIGGQDQKEVQQQLRLA